MNCGFFLIKSNFKFNCSKLCLKKIKGRKDSTVEKCRTDSSAFLVICFSHLQRELQLELRSVSAADGGLGFRSKMVGRTMEWASVPNHLGGIPRRMVFLSVGAFAKAVANFFNTTTVHNADTLIRLVRSRPPGVPLLTVSNHMSTLVSQVPFHSSSCLYNGLRYFPAPFSSFGSRVLIDYAFSHLGASTPFYFEFPWMKICFPYSWWVLDRQNSINPFFSSFPSNADRKCYLRRIGITFWVFFFFVISS